MDFLKDVLGEELYAQVSEKIGAVENIKLANIADGSYIPKAKFDELNGNLKTYKTQATELQTQLETLKTQAKGNEALQAEIQKLTQDLQQKDEAMKQQAFQTAVKDGLRSYKVHDPDVLMPLLNMKSITQNEDGSLVGLKEQMENMKTARPYLFQEEKKPSGGFSGGTVPPAPTANINDAINAAIRGAAGKQ